MFFHGEALLTPRPTPKLEDQPPSAVRDCLFNIFAATLHIGGCSSICNLRTRRAMVTGTHLSQTINNITFLNNLVCLQSRHMLSHKNKARHKTFQCHSAITI